MNRFCSMFSQIFKLVRCIEFERSVSAVRHWKATGENFPLCFGASCGRRSGQVFQNINDLFK